MENPTENKLDVDVGVVKMEEEEESCAGKNTDACASGPKIWRIEIVAAKAGCGDLHQNPPRDCN
jgi:hypothetical protein